MTEATINSLKNHQKTPSAMDPLFLAQSQVLESNAELERAFGKLKGQLNSGIKTATVLAETVKNPLLLTAASFIVGVVFGQLLRNGPRR